MMVEPLKALTQSFTRTKSKSFEEFKKSMELRTNSSNNTVYADAQGNIAYWHGNFMPIRDVKFDWSVPVDGSDPNTEWKGLHQVDETLHVYNPKNGWIQNCNSSPFAVREISPARLRLTRLDYRFFYFLRRRQRGTANFLARARIVRNDLGGFHTLRW